MKSDTKIISRRIFANLVDTGLEILGGILGSYFGMMMAALLESAKDGPPEQLASSMWSGFGFGFMFWTLSISFINRVLIQGLSRASIGKKIFKLELISVDAPLSWGTILGRWTMGFGSFALLGIGYLYAFFDKEGRTFHDLASHTDVVPHFNGSSMSVEYHEANAVAFPTYASSLKKSVTLVEAHAFAKEAAPAANVIPLPVAPITMPKIPLPAAATLAQVVRIHAEDDDSGSGSEAA